MSICIKWAFAMTLLGQLTQFANATEAWPSLPQPVDLRQEARLVEKTAKPLVMLFSLPDCAFCTEVRRNYLTPLIRDLPASQRPIVREVVITSERAMNDFAGAASTQSAFAARYKTKVAPTVIMMDATGKPLAEPIIGAGMAGFYGAFLDRALEQAEKALARTEHH
jgi:thioredoxin-related protein